ncbi:PEP-CTERM sorting domain-containing protein [Desulfococcaceae bacterium HSG9]|nr:PEP-CTERM sorting domain-containing protein [Desulfococcaceae bacterium HSG9]
MKKVKILFFGLICFIFSTSGASAVQFELFDWAFNIDGDISEARLGDDMFTGELTGELTDGLGTLSWTTAEAGDHSFLAWFDHQIDADINTFFNEHGGVSGSSATGQSWEIDEPGYLNDTYIGDVYDNMLRGTLDNLNNTNLISGITDDALNDVSMAMGWDFSLDTGQEAIIGLTLSHIAPETGFYLFHTDEHSDASIYLSSTLKINGNAPPVPEPGTMLLLCIGLAGMFGVRKKIMVKN